MNAALLILGDQLFPPSFYAAYRGVPVFMAEDLGLCTHYKYHKHKIAFFLTAMRNYADELRGIGHDVHYHSFAETPFLERLGEFVRSHRVVHLLVPEIQDKFFEKAVEDFCVDHDVVLEVIGSPMFLCPREEFAVYLKLHAKPFMKTFYERERKRLGILLEPDGKPTGGHWSYDVENRKKAPKVLTCKELERHQQGGHFAEVKKLVDEEFADHPGDLADFWLPTDRKGALRNLQHFVEHHLESFGDYQDAITNRAPFLYHSIISPAINAGLLTPEEVIGKVLAAREKNPKIPLSSVEGFVRQVMGWREFVRGIYRHYSEEEETRNFFGHERGLTKHWYEGTTGIDPVDDAIRKANTYGFCHHIERLMLLSNLMLLSELHPREVHRWFMEMFVDSADWVMGPNVYGMGQFSDGGIFATKPYVSGSNYVLKMSDYPKGPWCEVWDSLFWRFVGKHQKFFLKNYRLSMMVKLLEKMDPKKRRRHEEIAEEFIRSRTTDTPSY
jgi:deoxyribodipyrimidine photolyase-related protein